MKDLINKNVVGIKVITNYACNRRCKFCYQQRFDSMELHRVILGDRLREIKEHFYPVFITFQGGETTLISNWWDYMYVTSQVFPHSRQSLTTNGTAPLDEYKEAHKYGLSNITFSINSAEDKTLDKIIELSQMGCYTTHINTVVDYDNLDNFKELFDVAKAYNINFNACSNVLQEDPHAFYAVSKLINPDDWDKPLPHVTRFYKDGYSFWLHMYAPSGYNQIYVLPNGDYSIENKDVVEGKGAY